MCQAPGLSRPFTAAACTNCNEKSMTFPCFLLLTCLRHSQVSQTKARLLPILFSLFLTLNLCPVVSSASIMHWLSQNSVFAYMDPLNQKYGITSTRIYQNLNNSQKSTLSFKASQFSGSHLLPGWKSQQWSLVLPQQEPPEQPRGSPGTDLLLILHWEHLPRLGACCNRYIAVQHTCKQGELATAKL